MNYVCKPAKIQIYVNTARKTMAQIKKELGCDIIINGGIYNMSTFQPCCWLKVNGQLLAHDQYSYWGYGWNDAKLTMDSSVNIAKYQNYIACAAMLRDGHDEEMYLDAAMGGRRGRTAIGLRGDGSVVTWCTADGAYALTPEQLREEMRKLGCVSAMMLDGGGSCQCVMPTGQITSSRIVQNFLCIWIDKTPEKPVSNPQTPAQTPTPAPVCTDGTKAECKYRLPCHYCLKKYQMCPLAEDKT